jgi:hypothetical protein
MSVGANVAVLRRDDGSIGGRCESGGAIAFIEGGT